MALTDKLTNIANAIRSKTGKSAPMTLAEMPDEIMSIQGGGSSDVPFIWGGLNAELVSTYDEQYTLDDTSFIRGETAPSSATTIKASVSNAYKDTTGSPTVAYGDKDIVVLQYVNISVEHDSSADGKAQMVKSSYVGVSWTSKRKTTDTSAKTTRNVFSITNNMVKYLNASGVVTRASTGTYGIYAPPIAPSFASATASSTYVRVSSPTISARTSTTYEKADNMKKITDFTIDWHVEVYAVDPFTSIASAINDLQDAFLTDADSRMMGRMMPMMDDVDDTNGIIESEVLEGE